MTEEQVIIYQTPSSITAIDVRLENDRVWLIPAQIVILFEREQSLISKHIKNVSEKKNWKKKAICKICILLVQINQLIP